MDKRIVLVESESNSTTTIVSNTHDIICWNKILLISKQIKLKPQKSINQNYKLL